MNVWLLLPILVVIGGILTANCYVELGSGDADGVALAWALMSGTGVARGVEIDEVRSLRCDQFLHYVRVCFQNRMGSD